MQNKVANTILDYAIKKAEKGRMEKLKKNKNLKNSKNNKKSSLDLGLTSNPLSNSIFSGFM
jgi:hypothetical protein